MNHLTGKRVGDLLAAARRRRILVVGDVMLDQFIWGRVTRISPEAPVPVVEFEREYFMPGGAANVARNLVSLGAAADLCGVVGRDLAGRQLRLLLEELGVGCAGLRATKSRMTTRKVRILAQQQQVARVDRESRDDLEATATRRLWEHLESALRTTDAVIVGDYGKGVITQGLLDALRGACRKRGLWLSLDPKPVRRLELEGFSLITPNRKEAFALAGIPEAPRAADPASDPALREVAEELLARLKPALLMITLGEQGMLLAQRGAKPHHIPTVAQEVYDVSGAGDTVIASFTLAIAAGASPLEAAVFSNHAAGVVVGKVGTAAVTPDELQKNFRR